ncbi:hypothetical protein BH09BAC1_BH09BAC1_12590 [soil metagenome]
MPINVDFQEAIGIVTDKVNEWIRGTIQSLPNLAVALVVVVAFYFLAKFFRWGIKKVFHREHTNLAVLNLAATAIFIITFMAGVFIALGVLNLDKTVTSLLAGAGIIGLALGFAFQDTAANFLSGFIMAFRKPLMIGDHVESNDYSGIVIGINLRTTILRTFQGQEVMIPNKDVFNKPIVNYTKGNERRVDLIVGVSYGDDLDKVENVVLEAVKDLPGIDQSKDVRLEYTEFADSSINFRLCFWLDDIQQKGFYQTRSKAIKAIKSAFDANDITIPFPIRTLDFGIKGGQTYTEAFADAYKLTHSIGQGNNKDTNEGNP